MPATQSITAAKLARLIGTPSCPSIVDIRGDAAFSDLPALIPSSVRRTVDQARVAVDAPNSIIVCRDGCELSPAVAAWLRASGRPAETLEGGIHAWIGEGLPLIPAARLPAPDRHGRALWVTRSRPKVDRIACPWLIRRFVDREAQFLFVAPSEIDATAAVLGATPFDVDGAYWSHQGELCTFDVMLAEFGLAGWPGLDRLAPIVRGADTARPDLAPQCAGLLAISLGLSRLHADDHCQLDAGMPLYDAFFRWCRDAVNETHDWVSHQPRGAAALAAEVKA